MLAHVPDASIKKTSNRAKGEGTSWWGMIPQSCCIIAKHVLKTVAGASV